MSSPRRSGGGGGDRARRVVSDVSGLGTAVGALGDCHRGTGTAPGAWDPSWHARMVGPSGLVSESVWAQVHGPSGLRGHMSCWACAHWWVPSASWAACRRP